MFDAKSLIEMMMKGASPQAAQGHGQAGGGLGDILGQLGGMMGGAAGQGAGSAPAQSAGAAGGQMGGLEDILRKLGVGVPGGQGGAAPASTQSSANASGGGLGDILGQLQKQLGGAGAAPGSAAPSAGGMPGMGGGSIMDVLGQILSQATSGVKEGAGRIDGATGASGHMRDALGKATGQSPDEILAKLKDLIANNQMATGAGLGGLGALVLGTKTGRSMAGSAAKLGALALIGGLAYKAYQNYSNGQPPLGTGTTVGHAFTHEAAPQGSGFEADAITQDQATIYIRAMIAAAAADGRIDADEQKKILGGLQSAGVNAHAQQFLEQELNNPATVEDLIATVKTPQEAVQVYTAARVAIDPDTRGEAMFLAQLAAGLGIDATLAAHIDAAARAA